MIGNAGFVCGEVKYMLDTGFYSYESQYVQSIIRFLVKRFRFPSKNCLQRNHHAHISRNNIEPHTNHVIYLKNVDKPEHL